MCPRGAVRLDGSLPASLSRHVVTMLRPTLSDAAGRTTTITVLAVALATALFLSGPAGHASATTQAPTDLDHVIHTTPFDGSSDSMQDNEGSAYVPDDGSLWLADDNGRRLYEVDATSGQHKRTITPSDLSAVPQYGGGPVAGVNRSTDLEAIAYDADTDSPGPTVTISCDTAAWLFRIAHAPGE